MTGNGFLKKKILILNKQKTYALMYELHNSLTIPFKEELQKSFDENREIKYFKKRQKEFVARGDIFIEAIFHSGTGAYYFQYLDFLESKYKYDRKWLLEEKNFDIKQTKNLCINV